METLLIIDDTAEVRAMLRSYLGALDYQVLEAESGAAGLALCAGQRPDLVLLDIGMAGMDGFEVCRRLQADPATADIPVMFLSGSRDMQDKVAAFQAGGVDYVTKPFQMLEVISRIRTHLKLHEQKKQLARSSEELRVALDGAQLLNRKLVQLNERLRQSEALESQFLAMMRNEINNPLTSIMGLADEIPQLNPASPRLAELAGLIKQEAFNLDFHIRNVFSAGELEAGAFVAAVARVDVLSVLRDVVDSFQTFAKAQGVSLNLAVDSGEAGLVFPTDAEKLNLVITNLLANAIEYSHPGGVVSVRLAVSPEALTLAVEDHGIGIAEADREVIFARFHQLSTGVSRSHNGQGLGLTIVKALADMLGGSIQVTGGLGQGSTFTYVLPPCQEGLGPMAEAFDGNLFIFEEPEQK